MAEKKEGKRTEALKPYLYKTEEIGRASCRERV